MVIELIVPGMRLDLHCLHNNKKAWTQSVAWDGLSVGKKKQITTYKHKQNTNGRHPFNILTKEIYEN